ncbi:unnamed protein product [Ranitomeya imitator]|uniref:Reverse transcriptase domain-containing protein n=1 Tax=Ranitomeya imitator TaxID=111125 RepID=A0ABN9LNG6_9NEOB|nr:unnamed protein product [Ranitomeya imitator]
MKVSPSAVAKTIKRYKETGSHEDRPRKGRPRVTSASEDKFIRVTSLRNCRSVLYMSSDMFIITCAVESLFTSIPHEHGLFAVRRYLSSCQLDKFLMKLLEYALLHNYFVFKDRFYLQRRGVAMGAAFTPSYANLFMGLWEHEYIQNMDHTLMGSVILWMRFIDDILFVWQGSQTELDTFLQYLNDTSRVSPFPHMIQDSINFLGLDIMIDDSGQLHTSIYHKETGVNALLHAKSAHPAHDIRAIPMGQFLRTRWICDQNDAFEHQAKDLTARFLQRGYRRDIDHNAHVMAKEIDQQSLMVPKRNNKETDGHDSSLSKIIPKQPLIIAKRSKTLGDSLIHSQYVPPTSQFIFDSKDPKWGSYNCGSRKACQYMVKTNIFHDSMNAREYKILHYINRRTSMVIYQASCPCDLIYVGMTTRELRVHTLEHIKDIKAADKIEIDDVGSMSKLKPLARHFRKFHPHQSHLLKVGGIDRLYLRNRRGDCSKRLEQKECRWITLLQSMTPKGLKEQWGFSSFL